MEQLTIDKMRENLEKTRVNNIQNAKPAFWTTATLNNVLRQLRQLDPKPTIKRNSQAGTVVVSGPGGREALRGIKSPMGWVVRYDSMLIQKA